MAVVTGAGGGLGAAICHGFAEHGAGVALIDVDAEGLAAAADAVGAAGRTALAIEADASDEDAVRDAFERIDATFGRVDTLVNLAYAPVFGDPLAMTLGDWERAMKVNLGSYFLCCRAAATRMIAQGHGGTIVNMSSIAGTSAIGHGTYPYSVTKGGVVMLTRELAVEWARHGIRVNAIQPCQFLTPSLRRRFSDPAFSGARDRFLAAIPLGRFGEPEDIVGPVLFLASEASSMVTGILMPVDGGNLALNAGGVA